MIIIMGIIEVDKAFSKAVLKKGYKGLASENIVLRINVSVAVFHQVTGPSSALRNDA